MSSSPEITSVGADELVEPLGRLGVELVLGLPDLVGPVDGEVERPPLHGAYGVPHGGRHDVGSAVRAVDPGDHVGLDGRVEVAGLDGLALELPGRHQLVGLLRQQRAARRGQHQRGHQRRVARAPPRPQTPAPNEHPTTCARSMPRWSSTSSTSARGDHGPSGRSVDSPNPRRSTRTTSRVAVNVGQIGSHIRRSAMPAWISRSGVEPVGSGAFVGEHRPQATASRPPPQGNCPN